MENYELVVQNVKATLFDKVYREQGLISIINRKLDGYSPEDQERLSLLFTKQSEDVENVLGLLEQFDVKMSEILSRSEEILAITSKDKKIIEAGVEEAVSDNNVAGVSLESKSETNLVSSESTADVAISNVEVPTALDEKVAVSNEEAVTNDVPVSIEVSNDSVTSVVDANQVNTEEAPAEKVVNVAEVVQIPGQTSALEDDVTPTNEMVLAPVLENVAIPEVTSLIEAADNQLQAVENVKNEIVSNENLTADEKAIALEKYTRMTAGVVKAILVTKTQYEKLLASKKTQKALLAAKSNKPVLEGTTAPTTIPLIPVVDNSSVSQSIPVVPVGTEAVDKTSVVQADEQTLISNGLLAPTTQDKQKEMQTMIEQANELYKAGKALEAQELFNKVSAMNKELQVVNQGQALVKS